MTEQGTAIAYSQQSVQQSAIAHENFGAFDQAFSVIRAPRTQQTDHEGSFQHIQMPLHRFVRLTQRTTDLRRVERLSVVGSERSSARDVPNLRAWPPKPNEAKSFSMHVRMKSFLHAMLADSLPARNERGKPPMIQSLSWSPVSNSESENPCISTRTTRPARDSVTPRIRRMSHRPREETWRAVHQDSETIEDFRPSLHLVEHDQTAQECQSQHRLLQSRRIVRVFHIALLSPVICLARVVFTHCRGPSRTTPGFPARPRSTADRSSLAS